MTTTEERNEHMSKIQARKWYTGRLSHINVDDSTKYFNDLRESFSAEQLAQMTPFKLFANACIHSYSIHRFIAWDVANPLGKPQT